MAAAAASNGSGRRLSQQDVELICARHDRLFSARMGGARAVFAFHDLTGMDLSGRNLSDADFTGAILNDARLVAAGVTRVVYACEDPSPLASGQGSEQLIAAGIVVERGLLSQQAFEALGYGAWQGDVNSRLP